MVRRIGNIDGVKLYDIIRSEDNIRIAITEACKDHHKDPVVRAIKDDPEPYVRTIKEILDNESYKPGRFKFKTIYERGKKRRLCYTGTIDRMVQHCVFNIVAPILHATIISTQFSGVKGRGIHRGSKKVAKDLRENPKGTRYCLKGDIYHYFPQISRKLLFEMLKRKLKCRRTLNILHTIIFDCPNKDGLPIGLYSSQILSVFFLSAFDHYCKEVLRARFYYRYMDDFVFLSNCKEKLWSFLEHVREYLKGMELRVKGNYAVYPVEKRRLDFMGYVSNHATTMIRKRTKRSYIKSTNLIIRAITHHAEVSEHLILSKRSYEGMIENWTTENRLIEKYGGAVDTALEKGV